MALSEKEEKELFEKANDFKRIGDQSRAVEIIRNIFRKKGLPVTTDLEIERN